MHATNTRRRKAAALVLTGLMALAASGASAKGRHGGHHGLRGLEKRIEALELEPAVRDEIGAILDAAREDKRALRDGMREAHEALKALLEQETPDEAAVMAQADAIGALHADAHKQRLSVLLQIRPLLTPEQREELREHREHKWREGPGKRSLR